MADETNEDDSWLYGSSAEAGHADSLSAETNGNDSKHEHSDELPTVDSTQSTVSANLHFSPPTPSF